MSIANYIHTIRHLRPVQVYGRLRSRLPIPNPRLHSTPELRAASGVWVQPAGKPQRQLGPRRFRFLNEEREITSWNDATLAKLWLYNLHYFDDLTAAGAEQRAEWHRALMARWIAENPPGKGNGWEPYPLSLRIVNWIKWRLGGQEMFPPMADSLALQAEHLSRTLEYQHLGNHLFANAKALVFAGAFFHCDRWLRAGLEVLREQIPEQILADGGHFERSPMYQSVILEDLLDLVNLAGTYPGLLPDWTETAGRMMGWLSAMCHPDGQIAFFNDAAFGIAATPAELREYAKRLGVREQPVNLAPSGYVRLECGNTVVLFDAGAPGPDYQLAHAHADVLSLELSHRGRRVLVNSGTSTYEVGPERQRQRGTAAHNTVRVDGADQSEVWRAFRVARRARLLERRTSEFFASAAHDGYCRLPNPVVHRRSLSLTEGGLLVRDEIEGDGAHEIEIFWHLHPDVVVRAGEAGSFRLFCGGAEIGGIVMDGAAVEPSAYHPQFGLSVASMRIRGSSVKSCPASFATLIQLK